MKSFSFDSPQCTQTRFSLLPSILLSIIITTYFFSTHIPQISASDRQRGNIVRNDLDRVNNTNNYTITAMRSEGKLEGRRLELTVATEGYPNFRISRLSPSPESLIYNPKYFGGRKMSFRVGLYSLIEYR